MLEQLVTFDCNLFGLAEVSFSIPAWTISGLAAICVFCYTVFKLMTYPEEN